MGRRPGQRRGGGRLTRRIDLVALEDVPEGTLKMAFTDDHEQVVIVHSNGVIRAFQGICTHEYFELDKGFLTGGGSPMPDGRESRTLTGALHLSRFDLGTREPLAPPADLP